MAETGDESTRVVENTGGSKREDTEKAKDPPSIQYLSKPTTTYTCYFLVGDPESEDEPQELIGGCKLNLMAHSETLRRMLEESPIAEKGTKEDPIKLPDVQPVTFRQFLRYVHGKKDISYLSLEEAVDLIYLGEKYLAEEFKADLGTHMASLITVDNVFLPMQRNECFQTEVLKNAIDKIIQYDTKALLEREDFLYLNNVGLLNIVKQEGLAVTEIELWRAVLKWAKHNAENEEGPTLRETIGQSIEHIRFSTFTFEYFCKEVVLSDILTKEEIKSVIRMKVSQKNKEYNNIGNDSRKLLSKETVKQVMLNKYKLNNYLSDSSYLLLTKKCSVELTNAEFQARQHNWKMAPEDLQYHCKCNIYVTRITNYHSNTSSEQPVQFTFSKNVLFGKTFDIPFKNMKLLANTKYRIKLSFDPPLACTSYPNSNIYDSQALRVVNEEMNQGFACHFLKLSYKTLGNEQ